MYKKLVIAISINAVLMYLITYVMIDDFDHFYNNINRVYMSLMMVAPMVIVMLLVMSSMYENKKLNYILIASSAGLFILCFSLARTQVPIGNTQFLRSMIPHHSSAIVMCQESDLTDPEILKLCEQIIKTQEEEITQMKAILERSR
jgi:uncharacterized protein (DUF305 family)